MRLIIFVVVVVVAVIVLVGLWVGLASNARWILHGKLRPLLTTAAQQQTVKSTEGCKAAQTELRRDEAANRKQAKTALHARRSGGAAAALASSFVRSLARIVVCCFVRCKRSLVQVSRYSNTQRRMTVVNRHYAVARTVSSTTSARTKRYTNHHNQPKQLH